MFVPVKASAKPSPIVLASTTKTATTIAISGPR